MSANPLVFRVHAIQRMFQRHISKDDVRHVFAESLVSLVSGITIDLLWEAPTAAWSHPSTFRITSSKAFTQDRTIAGPT